MEEIQEDLHEDEEQEEEINQRPRRTRAPPEIWTYTHSQMVQNMRQTARKKATGKKRRQEKLMLFQAKQKHNLCHDELTMESIEYTDLEAMMIKRLIDNFNYNQMTEWSFIQQYLLHRGLELYWEKGKEAMLKEMRQQLNRRCFQPIKVSDMTPQERKRAQIALVYLCEKWDAKIKGRNIYNGKPTREWLGLTRSCKPNSSFRRYYAHGSNWHTREPR